MYCRDITGISIHAPRTGSDFARPLITPLRYHFNPRSPHGERRGCFVGMSFTTQFQSTLPARGATCCQLRANSCNAHFNPRSPHGERRKESDVSSSDRNFNPRSPHGERPRHLCQGRGRGNFNPRSPHGERRCGTLAFIIGAAIFQSTLPARGATAERRGGHALVAISIHAPRTGSDARDVQAHSVD